MHSARMMWYAFAAGTTMACGGGARDTADTANAAPSSTAGTATAGSSQTAATAPAAAAAITGKTWDVKMLGDEKGYRFDPVALTIKPGDGVRFVNVSGGPHNVAFWADSIPASAATALQANMPQQSAPLTGPLVSGADEAYTVSFAGAPTGAYKYNCTVHLALGMVAAITVQ